MEKDPVAKEKEYRNAAKRARKSYEKGIIEKNPKSKIKIERRPYKYKDGDKQ